MELALMDGYFGTSSGACSPVDAAALSCPVANEYLEQQFGVFRGSGGSLVSNSLRTASGANLFIQPAPKNNIREITDSIRDTFGLSVTALVNICHLQSRKTYYNWMDGKSTPHSSSMSRIYDLLLVAKAWKNAGFPNPKGQLTQPVLDDQSLLDLLNQAPINKDLILFAGSRLNLSAPPQATLRDPFAT